MKQFCAMCVNPVGLTNAKGEPVEFSERDGMFLCQPCIDYLDHKVSVKTLKAEMDGYLDSHSRILFAYSGGLDSSVVLAELLPVCRKKGVDIDVFTVETGVKGRVTWENVKNVIDWLGLQERHFVVDITNRIESQPQVVERFGQKSVTDVYLECFRQGILPCGKICNSMMDQTYIGIMNDRGYTELVTGGDTPKKNCGQYSTFWCKNESLTVVRGGISYGRTKLGNLRYVQRNGMPWQHPQCGGYDTDCLVPGAFFADEMNGDPHISLDVLLAKYPIIFDYLSERVRFGKYPRQVAMRLLQKVDVSSLPSYIEISQILRERQENQ